MTDQERALAFYGGLLGLETRVDAPLGAGRWIEVAPAGAPTTVALALAREGTTVGVDTGVRFTTEDTTADHEAVRAAGVDVDPEVLRYPGAPPMFSFRDPDGNTLDRSSDSDRSAGGPESIPGVSTHPSPVAVHVAALSGTVPRMHPPTPPPPPRLGRRSATRRP